MPGARLPSVDQGIPCDGRGVALFQTGAAFYWVQVLKAGIILVIVKSAFDMQAKEMEVSRPIISPLALTFPALIALQKVRVLDEIATFIARSAFAPN